MKKVTIYKNLVGELTVNYKRTEQLAQKISSSDDSADFIRPYFEHVMDDHEVVKVIHLNHENRVINVHHASSGTDTACLVPIKAIVRNAIMLPTTGIILVHNHPSGQTKFSEADIVVSKKLKIACNYFDVRFVDSIVITREKHSSMKDERVI